MPPDVGIAWPGSDARPILLHTPLNSASLASERFCMSELARISRSSQRPSAVGRLRTMLRKVAGQAWRLAILLVGMMILALGVVLLPLPGPGMLVVVLGMGVLSVEFAWARSGLARLKAAALQLRQRAHERLSGATRDEPPTS